MTNLVKVQEDFHKKEEAKLNKDEYDSRISQQISQRKHSKFVNKSSTLSNLISSQNTGVVDRNKANDRNECIEKNGWKTTRKIGTPDLTSINKWKQEQWELTQNVYNESYKEMIKSNITSFREAVDIANKSKFK